MSERLKSCASCGSEYTEVSTCSCDVVDRPSRRSVVKGAAALAAYTAPAMTVLMQGTDVNAQYRGGYGGGYSGGNDRPQRGNGRGNNGNGLGNGGPNGGCGGNGNGNANGGNGNHYGWGNGQGSPC